MYANAARGALCSCAVNLAIAGNERVQTPIGRIHRDRLVRREELLGQRQTNLTWLVSPPQDKYQCFLPRKGMRDT